MRCCSKAVSSHNPLTLVLELAHLAQDAVRAFEQSSSGVVRPPIFCKTSLHPNFFAHVVDEELPVDTGSLQRDERVRLERPGFDFSVRILDVHVEVTVRILPIDFRQYPRKFSAPVC